jgi:formyl-CoA transferase
MSGALEHLRVVEIAGGVAAPFCGKLMASQGAEVIKIEALPTGDPTRSQGPFADDPGPETSLPFLWLNTAKKSVAIDLESGEGLSLVQRLAVGADIVIESFPPGTLQGTGLSYDELSAEQPDLIMVSVTPFGQDGPYSGFLGDEIVAYAMGGGMHLTGDPDREPLVGGLQVAHGSAGMAAYLGALAAAFDRGRGGGGRHVDISIQEAMLDNIEIALVEYLHTGRVARRTGDRHALVPWQLYPCRDGWAAVIGGPVRNWLDALEDIEAPRLADAQFRHVAGRMAHPKEFEKILESWLSTHDRADVLARGRQHGLAFGVLNRPEEVLDHPQHRERGFFQRIDHPLAGELVMCGEAFRVAGAPAVHGRAPLLGEHTTAVLTGLMGMSAADVEDLLDSGVAAAAGGAS